MRCDHIGCRTGDRDVDGCDTRDIDVGGRDLGVFEGHNCDCGFGLKCLAAWKEDMQVYKSYHSTSVFLGSHY